MTDASAIDPSDPLIRELNERFYSANPSAYFRMRLRLLGLVGTNANAIAAVAPAGMMFNKIVLGANQLADDPDEAPAARELASGRSRRGYGRGRASAQALGDRAQQLGGRGAEALLGRGDGHIPIMRPGP